MTMFTRSDKAPDPTGAKPSTATPPSTPAAAAAAEPRPAQPRPAYTPAAQAASISVISKALKITGQLESTEDIQIEGEIDGDVRAVTVKVGANAKVKGTVYGDEVELAGSVEGKIEARKVVLTATAHMSGDVVHNDIRIDSGAYINGHCKPEYGKTSNNVQPLHKPAAPDKA
ncbi:MAG: polymer-forming cytoskeletal protein [Alphaproteobacteria bacterium]|nr:polymer-forming cytoskeletal protein [Alphaproteobacteria bacterium]